MYEQFFGFRERPFDLTPNPRYLVMTESHQEALSNLRYGIASRKGITLLIGEAGSGKTTVIRTAIAGQPNAVHCVHLHNPMLSRAEFVEILASRFSLSADARRSKATMLIELETMLEARRERNETTVLVVDEAQSLPAELLEEIRLLVNIETDDEKLLSVIIAGQPEIVERLNHQSLRQLKQRIALRCELKPLTVQETAGYIAGRIKAAGGTDLQIFTRDAIALIHERAQGLPRTISVVADNALLGGFAAQQRPVGSQIVWDVCQDFDIGPPGRVGRPPEAGETEATAVLTPAAAGPLLATPRLTASADRAPARPAERPAAALERHAADNGRPVSKAGEMFAAFKKRRRFSIFG